ncbi:DUF2490 domain-containing protein [Sandarakinorhabdus sp.]|uniref:DUF2490 domain-containing protein n=1 Tax=Sandarakinorhabdus sp. TaxID=1916663 RepID=UPI00286E5907|nr:DUF2490 domain-containing protein [Sandarakinorhabdus sp.]
MFRICPAALFLSLVAAPAAGQARPDEGQMWMTLQARIPAGRQFMLLEVQQRLTDNLSRPGQTGFRIGYGGPVAPALGLQAGYQYFYIEPARGAASSEHRLWQQADGPLARLPGDIRLAWRLRLEERLLEGSDDLGWRLRGQLRATIGDGRKIAPVLFTEGFAMLNRTDWGQRTGRDQWRVFAGVNLPVSRDLRIEAGYMHIKLWRPSGDRDIHVANVTLFLRP